MTSARNAEAINAFTELQPRQAATRRCSTTSAWRSSVPRISRSPRRLVCVLQTGDGRQSRRCGSRVQSRVRELARARHAWRRHVAARGRAPQPGRRCGALGAGRGASGVGKRSPKGSGRRISPSVCRRRTSSGTRSRRARARFRRISSASRPTLDAASSLRVEEAIAAAEQRDQRELAAFHLESGRRLFRGGTRRRSDRRAAARRSTCRPTIARRTCCSDVCTCGRPGVQDAIDELKISIWSDDRIDAHLVLADAYIHAARNDAARASCRLC